MDQIEEGEKPKTLKDLLSSIADGRDERNDLMLFLMDAAIERLVDQAGDHRVDGSHLEKFACALFARVQVGLEVDKSLRRDLVNAQYDIKNLQRENRGLTATQLQQSAIDTELRSLLEASEEQVRKLRGELEQLKRTGCQPALPPCGAPPTGADQSGSDSVRLAEPDPPPTSELPAETTAKRRRRSSGSKKKRSSS